MDFYGIVNYRLLNVGSDVIVIELCGLNLHIRGRKIKKYGENYIHKLQNKYIS